MKNRIVSLLMAIVLLFSFASCDLWADKDKKDELPPRNEDDFAVEIEPVEYSDEAIAEASAKVVALSEELADILGYSQHFGDEERKNIENKFKDDVIAILIDVMVYPEELFSMLECAEECIGLYEEQNNEESNPKIISDLYTQFISILDTDRLGALTYELQLMMLGLKIDKAQEKYDKHGSSFYLEDVEYFTALTEKARSLGRDKFTDAFSVITFSATAFNGSLSFDGGGIDVSVYDVFEIMKKQGERFASLTLTESDWQTVAEVIEAFLPESGKTVKEKLLITLGYDDFFIEAADIMPDLLKFYADLTADISKENMDLVAEGGEYAYEIAICRELIKDETGLREILGKLEEKIPAPTSRSITSIKSYDKAGYNAFCQKYSTDSDGLIEAVRAFLNDSSDENYEALRDAYFGYLASINSVVTYVYIYS